MKNQYSVTWKLYRSWIIESMFRETGLVFRFFWCILLCTCIASALIIKEVAIFFWFMGLFCLYRAFFRDLLVGYRQYKRVADHHNGADWLRIIEFHDEGITLREGTSTIQFLYDGIVKIQEKQDRISIVMKDKSVLRLYHSTFVEGDWDGCKKKIEAYRQEKKDQILRDRECNPEKFHQEKESIKERLRKRILKLILAILLFVICVVISVILNLRIQVPQIDFNRLEKVQCEVTRVAKHVYKANTTYDYYTTYEGKERRIYSSNYSLKKGMNVSVYVYKGKFYADEISIMTSTKTANVYYVFLVIDMIALWFLMLQIAYLKQDRKQLKEMESP